MNLIDDKNEIVVPMTEGELSEDFREFIERDPSFTPEIYSQNLLNVLLQQDSLTTTDKSERLLTLKTLSLKENLKAETSQFRAIFLLMKINFEALFADRIYLMSCVVFTGLIHLHVLSDAIKSFYSKVFDQEFAI